MDFLPSGPVWLPLFVAAPFVLLPVLILLTQKFQARPTMDELDLKALPKRTAGFLMDRTRDLIDLGFTEPTTIALPDPVPNVKGYLIVLVHRPSGDKAMATVLVGDDGLTTLKTSYVEFSTRFDTGEVFDTNNSDQLGAFRPGRATTLTKATRVKDVTELYDLHRHVMSLTPPAGKPWVFPPGAAVDYLAEYAFEKTLAEQAARGWLRPVDGGRAYRPTVVGAYLMTWGLMPPASWVRKWRHARRTDRLLADMRDAA